MTLKLILELLIRNWKFILFIVVFGLLMLFVNISGNLREDIKQLKVVHKLRLLNLKLNMSRQQEILRGKLMHSKYKQLTKVKSDNKRWLLMLLMLMMPIAGCQTVSPSLTQKPKEMTQPELSTSLPSKPYLESVQENLSSWQSLVMDTFPISDSCKSTTNETDCIENQLPE